MAVKITKKPPASYPMSCPRCGTGFTYAMDDVVPEDVNDSVRCPTCGHPCMHRWVGKAKVR